MGSVHETVGSSLVGVCRAHRNRAAMLLGELGLYVGQEWILFQLREEDGSTPTALALSCGVEIPTISKALQRMESAGYVSRRDDREDARVTRIHLTNAGRELCDRVEAAWAELEQQTVAGLSTEERILLRRLLLHVRENLD